MVTFGPRGSTPSVTSSRQARREDDRLRARDIRADTRLIWLGSRAIAQLDSDQWPMPLALKAGAPFALRADDIRRVAPVRRAHGMDAMPVTGTGRSRASVTRRGGRQ